MTPAEEQALVREMQAIADAVTDVLNRASSLDAAPAGVALGLLQAMKGRGPQHLPLARAHGRNGSLHCARSPGRRPGCLMPLFFASEERDRFMERFRVALLHLAGIELPVADRRPVADDFVAPD